jgi:hypothetical protein
MSLNSTYKTFLLGSVCSTGQLLATLGKLMLYGLGEAIHEDLIYRCALESGLH